MKIESAKTWPMAVRETDNRVLLGLPQRLGDGKPLRHATYDTFPSLEAVVGDIWLSRVLSSLLPPGRAWAWWTRTGNGGLKQLSARRSASALSVELAGEILVRRKFWRGMALAVIPPNRSDAQEIVLDWAGIDTEDKPEFIFAGPPEQTTWDCSEIEDWCLDRSAWREPATIDKLPAERIVVLFDGDVYCACLPAQTAPTIQAVEALATSWGLSVIAGPVEMAWPDGCLP